MGKLKYFIFFLLLNFGSLALGSYLMNNGPRTDWYLNLNKAPWTPPGWAFGTAWTAIMICFSVYLSYLFTHHKTRLASILFTIQVVLNISWNYVFFNQHKTILGLIIIALLTWVIFSFFFKFKVKRSVRYLLVPYMLWLCIATSLNAYVVFNN